MYNVHGSEKAKTMSNWWGEKVLNLRAISRFAEYTWVKSEFNCRFENSIFNHFCFVATGVASLMSPM